MAGDALRRILREQGEDVLSLLTEKLTPSDLQTLLMEVYRLRGGRQPMASLLKQHEENRFLMPSPVDPLILLEFDTRAFRIAADLFQPIELSPLAPLGTTSAVTNVSQNNVVATVRNSDVMADPTNAMALECGVRRRQLVRSGNTKERVRLCCSHRVTRAQAISGRKSWAHFRLFAAASSGQDEGSFTFETEEMVNHIALHLRILRDWPYQAYSARVVVSNFEDEKLTAAQSQIAETLQSGFPDVKIQADSDRQSGRTYYAGLCFRST